MVLWKARFGGLFDYSNSPLEQPPLRSDQRPWRTQQHNHVAGLEASVPGRFQRPDVSPPNGHHLNALATHRKLAQCFANGVGPVVQRNRAQTRFVAVACTFSS